MESTYGDRERPPLQPGRSAARLLAAEVRDAQAAGGPLLMPAFAVERTQELLADLLQVMEEGDAPPADVFLDSPLAIEATEVFLRARLQPDRRPQSVRRAARRRAPALPQEATGERPSGTAARLARDHGRQRHVRRGPRAQAPEAAALARATRPCC